MKRLTLMAITLLVVGAAGPVSAQYVPPSQRPAYSPYLNLLRGGSSFTQNYFGLVQPQFNDARQFQQQQQQIQANRQAINDTTAAAGTNPLLPATGHNFGYLTQGSYFLNNNRGGSGRTAGLSQTSFGTANRPAGAGYTPPSRSGRSSTAGSSLSGGGYSGSGYPSR